MPSSFTTSMLRLPTRIPSAWTLWPMSRRALHGRPTAFQHVPSSRIMTERRYRVVSVPVSSILLKMGASIVCATPDKPLRCAPAWPVRFDPVIGELANRNNTAPVTFRLESPGHASQAPRPNKDQGLGKGAALPTGYCGAATPRSRAWRLRLRRCRQSPRDARGAALGCIQKCRRPCLRRGDEGFASSRLRVKKSLSYSVPLCFILFDEVHGHPSRESCRTRRCAPTPGGYHSTGRE